MRCPKCRHADTKVYDSRTSSEGMAIRRRRECRRCSFRFSTVEEIAILDLTVVKRDGRREPYSREKVLAGIRKSFERRSITTEELLRLVAVVERDIQMLRKSEVRSTEIGEIILQRLRKVDEVAYVRFASVYQSFENLEGFWQVLRSLKASNKTKSNKKLKVKSRRIRH
ncbi:MAG: transcriptional regulator NrdR [Candidatus Uhrbacteria bacterium]